MIKLLGNCMLIKRDAVQATTASGIFFAADSQKIPDTGTIIHVGPGLDSNLLGTRVRFRESFKEEIDIEGEMLLFFRDYESSLYYVIEDDN